jgi:hypothetical protein
MRPTPPAITTCAAPPGHHRPTLLASCDGGRRPRPVTCRPPRSPAKECPGSLSPPANQALATSSPTSTTSGSRHRAVATDGRQDNCGGGRLGARRAGHARPPHRAPAVGRGEPQARGEPISMVSLASDLIFFFNLSFMPTWC